MSRWLVNCNHNLFEIFREIFKDKNNSLLSTSSLPNKNQGVLTAQYYSGVHKFPSPPIQPYKGTESMTNILFERLQCFKFFSIFHGQMIPNKTTINFYYSFINSFPNPTNIQLILTAFYRIS